LYRNGLFIRQKMPVCQKLHLRRAACLLRRGGLVAHHTGTLPGVAAMPYHPAAAVRLCRFKQRRGPFLLLADSPRTAISLAAYLPPVLRRAMRSVWPGPVTFVVPAAGASAERLSSICFTGRSIAVRVDADPACRYLARLCGGLLVSSSLNRRNQPVRLPDRRLRMRWHRHLAAQISSGGGSGNASSLLKWSGSRLHVLRGPAPV
jgi:L-threonylcarbamoyladenylate synthase